MNKLIYISGVDGAGKTTISKKILDNFSNKKVYYSWATLRPFLLLPFIKIAKFLIVRKHDKYSDYSKHKKKKQESLAKFKFFLKPQFVLALIDYYPQFLYKIAIKIKIYDMIIVDRYYIDFFIERGMLANWGPEKTFKYILFYQNFFLIPNNIFYLKINPELALSRKNDIPSIEYLNDRMIYYNYIHQKLGSVIIDASNSIENIVNEIKEQIL